MNKTKLNQPSRSSQIRDYATALTVFSRASLFLRDELGGEVTLNQLALLAEVMRTEALGSRIEMREVALVMDIDRRAVSRFVAMLGRGYAGRAGLNLIAQAPAEHDKRSRLVSLTEKGAAFTCRIAELLRREALSAVQRIEQLRDQRAPPG